MNDQLKKGILEMVILMYLKNEELYGYQIIERLESQLKVKEASVYTILTRMKQKGYLNERVEMKGKKPIRYLKLSDDGDVYLKGLLEGFEQIVELIDNAKGRNNE